MVNEPKDRVATWGASFALRIDIKPLLSIKAYGSQMLKSSRKSIQLCRSHPDACRSRFKQLERMLCFSSFSAKEACYNQSKSRFRTPQAQIRMYLHMSMAMCWRKQHLSLSRKQTTKDKKIPFWSLT